MPGGAEAGGATGRNDMDVISKLFQGVTGRVQDGLEHAATSSRGRPSSPVSVVPVDQSAPAADCKMLHGDGQQRYDGELGWGEQQDGMQGRDNARDRHLNPGEGRTKRGVFACHPIKLNHHVGVVSHVLLRDEQLARMLEREGTDL